MRGTFEIGHVVEDPEETRVVNAVSEVFGAGRARAIAILSGPCTCGRTDHQRFVVLVGFRWWHAARFHRLNQEMRSAALAAIGAPAAVSIERMPRAMLSGGLEAQRAFLEREQASP